MNRRLAVTLAVLLCFVLSSAMAASASSNPPTAVAEFAPEVAPASLPAAAPAPPSFVGTAVRRAPDGHLVPLGRTRVTAAARQPERRLPRALALGDYYVLDGSGSSVTVNPWNGQNVVAAYNEGWDFEPDLPISSSTTGNNQWSARVFPLGEGVYQGFPFSPWCNAGNTSGEFFSTLIRHDLFPTDNSHVVVSRSTDNGQTFSKFHEVQKDVFQDRCMVDIDRPAALGGTTGPHDGKVYLCYDDYGPAGSAYVGSFLRVLSSTGTLLSEIQLSGTGSVPFRGNQFQPVAADETRPDGTLFLVSSAVANGGATAMAHFYEIRGAGGDTLSLKSTRTWAPVGQRLGASQRWGVNGHRIDNHGFLAIDRSSGPLRSRLYFITSRNPNPTNPTRDQGDIHLSVSTSGGLSWMPSPALPTAAGRTQFFPMMDVDSQGWIHVAYYENGDGLQNNGVLNAGSAHVLYTVSRDGGETWAPSLPVNESANALVLEDPPVELGAFDYYMIGDYMQLRAVGAGAATSAYVLWTGYDKYRSDEGLGTKKERVMATWMSTPAAPGTSPGHAALLALVLASAGAAALFTRRRAAVPERVPRDD